jgi:hypothetical protein
MPSNLNSAINPQPIFQFLFEVASVIVGYGVLLVIVVGLIYSPIVTVAALLKGKKPDGAYAEVAFWELVALVILLIIAAFHFHVVKWE